MKRRKRKRESERVWETMRDRKTGWNERVKRVLFQEGERRGSMDKLIRKIPLSNQ